MKTTALRQQLKPDANQMVHIAVPVEMGDEVEVFIFPRRKETNEMPLDSLAAASLMDESGFARNILNNPEEDCWNDL